MTKLSVNINKLATLRNARGGNLPDIIKTALDIERFGADGITVHPRPDERHIRYKDVRDLKPLLKTEFNIEGFPTKNFIDLVGTVKPTQVTLVPDAPDAITSNAGWDTVKNGDFLKEVVSEFKKNGIRVSLFVDTNINNIEHAVKTGTDRIELYTESYASHYETEVRSQKSEVRLPIISAIKPYIKAAKVANKLGLGLNAGHDLNLQNLRYFAQNITGLLEVSIGHALICDALIYGLENSIQMYLKELKLMNNE